MLINIKNKKDLITLDFYTKEIRYIKDIVKQGEIFFISLSNDDINGYKYLFGNDKGLFLDTIREDILNNLGIKTNTKNLIIDGGLKSI